jgi:hypothetical protein
MIRESPPLSRRRFARLVRERGPGLEHWPAADREAARRLLARSALSRTLYLRAINREAPAFTDDAALERILLRTRLFPLPEARRLRTPSPFSLGGLAAAAALGVLVGIVSPIGQTPADPLESLHAPTLVELP